MLGFEISFFDRETLAFLYREIFGRQHYCFRSRSENPVIFDCGANLGMATLYFKWLYPRSRIHAFEPDPETFAVLQSNILRNRLTDVTTHNCALWDHNGTVDFFVNHEIPGSLLMSTDPTRCKGAPLRVPSRVLSEFLEEPVDFVKLDVEGAEHQILSELLQSGKASLINQMVIEYHHHIGSQPSHMADFLRMLEQAKFEYQIHAPMYPVTAENVFQDIMIGAYRRHSS